MGATLQRHSQCVSCTETVTLPVVTQGATVAGYPDTPTPPIAPYVRPDATDRPDECGDGNQPRCGAWPRSERPVVGDCTGTFQSWNCYVSADSTVVRTMDKRGEILLQSRKAFHGRDGFTFCPDTCGAYGTRYLSIATTVDFAFTDDDNHDNDYAAAYSGAFSVGRTSGVVTGTGTATGDGGITYSEEDVKYFALVLGSIRTQCACFNTDDPPVQVDCSTEGATAPEAIWGGPTYSGLESPEALRNAHLFTNGLWRAANGDFTGGIPEAELDITINSIGATVIELEATWDNTLGQVYYFYVKVELSSPYTAADVEDDMQAAISLWSLANRKILPWRNDGYRALGPIIRYDESPSASSPDVGAYDGPYGMAYDGTLSAGADDPTGAITGQPIEATFADGDGTTSFDFDHIKYTDLTTTPVPTEYGAFSDGTIVPHSAGHWTNNYIAGLNAMWPGSGYWFDPDEEVLHCQKHAEVKPLLASFNFFSRAGYKRWLPDSGFYTDGTTDNTSWHIAGFDGADPQVETDITADLTTGMLVVFNKGPNDGEIYYLDSFSYDGGTTLTTIVLGAQLVTDSSEWTALKIRVKAAHATAKWTIGQGDYGRISFLRYQYDRSGSQWPSDRAIVGRVAVTASYSSGSGLTTFTTASATELITGDKVDILDSTTATDVPISGGSNLSVTWVSNTSFTVAGDKTSGAAFVKSTGAPYYGWNDVASYGDFIIRATESSIVDGVYTLTNTRTDDSKTGQCAVISCSPDGDDPAGAKVVAFPGVPSFTICGGRKWKQFATYSIAPDWQDPVSQTDIFTACAEYVEVRTGIRSGTRGGEACPALPDHCIFTAPAAPVEGAGYAGTTTVNTADGPWMSSCIYP